MKDLNVYECRLCTRYIWSVQPLPGYPVAPGWKLIKNIDGPNHVCPLCAASKSDVLMFLREDGYPNAKLEG